MKTNLNSYEEINKIEQEIENINTLKKDLLLKDLLLKVKLVISDLKVIIITLKLKI